MANTIRLRRGLEADRTTITPAEGEMIYTTDTNSLYIGDGSTAGGVKFDFNLDDIDVDTITANQLDINGTVTAYGLTSSDDIYVSMVDPELRLLNTGSAGGEWRILGSESLGATSSFRVYQQDEGNRFKIANNGDISFYEDTGATPKLVWKAGDERLGIGTSSPSKTLNVESTTGSAGTPNGLYLRNYVHGSNSQIYMYAENDAGTLKSASISLDPDAENFILRGNGGGDDVAIDSSGNLLVGKTSSSFSTVGVEATSTGKIRATMSSDNPISLNRTTTDGGIAVFAKDGATVGAIGTEGGDLTVGTGDVGLKFNDASGLISPWDMTANAPENGTIDLGYVTGRFKDAYLSGGIYLGGTGAANKLDDYEEGTHVATVTPSTSGTITLTSTIDTLGYTKIGRQVTITGYLNVQSVSSPVGSYVSVTLPFSIGGVDERGEDIGGAAQVYDYSVGGWIAAPFDGIYGNVGIRVYYPVASTQGGTIFRFSFSYFTLA